MKRAPSPLLLLGLGLVVGTLAFGGIRVPAGHGNSTQVQFINCGANGTATQTIPSPGEYLLNVSGDEAVRLCFDVACDGGNGTPFAPNFEATMTFIANPDGGAGVGCRSDGGTGDATLTKVFTH